MMPNRGGVPAARTPIIANLGIHLSRLEGHYVLSGRMPDGTIDPSGQRLQLPRIPNGLLESCCGLVRAFWRRHQCCVAILLYLDLDDRTWNAYLPAQTVVPDDIRAQCDFKGFCSPTDRMRIAGSIRSWPSTIGMAPELYVLPKDGLHILVNPQLPWISVLGFVYIDGTIVPTPIGHLIDDEYDAMINTLGPRFQFVDEL